MDDEIRQFYLRCIKKKLFSLSDFKELKLLLLRSVNCHTPLCEALQDAWYKTHTGRNCYPAQKARFNAVIAHIAPFIGE